MRHRRTSHLARVILLTLPLLLAVAAPARAQDPITSSMLGPFQGVYNYPGGGSCSTDVVTFVGTAHAMCQVPTSPTGEITCYINLLADRGTGATRLISPRRPKGCSRRLVVDEPALAERQASSGAR